MLDAFQDTYAQLVAFYLAARMFMGSYYFLLASVVPMVRGMMLAHTVLALIPSALWIGSIYVDMPRRLGLIWVAIFIELCGAMLVVVLIRGSGSISKRLAEWVERVFEFYPAVNIEHKVERTNAFVTLVFGYSVVAIIYQNASSLGFNAFFGKAALGLVQAFCFNWIYFELDGADLFTHAIRRNVSAGKSPLDPNCGAVLTMFSNALGCCASPIYHELRSRRGRSIEARYSDRLQRHKARILNRNVHGKISSRGSNWSSMVLLRRIRYCFSLHE